MKTLMFLFVYVTLVALAQKRIGFVNKGSPSYVPSAGDCGVSLSNSTINCNSDCETKLGEYPWMVLLGRESVVRGKKLNRFYCGGSLLNNWFVLTASHCLEGMSQGNFVRVGEWKVVDTDNFDKTSCKYYNEKTKMQSINDRTCGKRKCSKENGDLDCQIIDGQRKCAEKHQVLFKI